VLKFGELTGLLIIIRYILMEQSWFDGSIMADAICAFTHLSSYFFLFLVRKITHSPKKKNKLTFLALTLRVKY